MGMNSFYYYLRLAFAEASKASPRMMSVYLNDKKNMATGCLGVSLTFIKRYAQLSICATDKLLFLNQGAFIRLNSRYKLNGAVKNDLEKIYYDFKLKFDPSISDPSDNIYKYFDEIESVLDRNLPGSFRKYNSYLCDLARELAVENYELYKERY